MATINAELRTVQNAAPESSSGWIALSSPVSLPRAQLMVRPALPGNEVQQPNAINLHKDGASGTDSDDGWGSDFDDDELSPAERRWCLDRFDWEDRQMSGRTGEPPPVPPRV